MVVNLPKNSEWGPHLWKLLHSLVQRAGTARHPSMLIDQRREILIILRAVEFIMPCALCRKHYHDWRTRHPPDKLPEGVAFFIAAQKWLYDLHVNVNQSRSVENVVAFDALEDLYGKTAIATVMQDLMILLQNAVLLRAIDTESLKTFKAHCTLLQRFF